MKKAQKGLSFLFLASINLMTYSSSPSWAQESPVEQPPAEQPAPPAEEPPAPPVVANQPLVPENPQQPVSQGDPTPAILPQTPAPPSPPTEPPVVAQQPTPVVLPQGSRPPIQPPVAPPARVQTPTQPASAEPVIRNAINTRLGGLVGRATYVRAQDGTGTVQGAGATVGVAYNGMDTFGSSVTVVHTQVGAGGGATNRGPFGGVAGRLRFSIFPSRNQRGCHFSFGTTGSADLNLEENSPRPNQFATSAGVEPALICNIGNAVTAVAGLAVGARTGIPQTGYWSNGANASIPIDVQVGENLLIGAEGGINAVAGNGHVVSDAYARISVDGVVGPVLLGAHVDYTHVMQQDRATGATTAADVIEAGAHGGIPF